jgi:hypothetical protein
MNLTILMVAVLGMIAWGEPGTDTGAPAPAAGGEARQSVDYRFGWSWPAGPVVYELVRETTDVLPVPGKDPVVEQTVARRVRHERTGVTGAGAAAVRTTWEAIRFARNDSLNTPLSYDSGDASQAGRLMHPVIGTMASALDQSVTLLIEADGRVTGAENIEPFLRGIEINLTKSGLAGERTYERLQVAYTPETLARSGTSTYGFLPAGPLAVGSSYEVVRTVTLEHVQTLETVETHTLEGVETDGEGRTVARFSVTGTLRWPDPGGRAGEAFNVSLDKAVVTGAWSFDVQAGLVIESTLSGSFLADIVRYDPRTRMSAETSTRQSFTDRMTLVPAGEAGEASSP